MEQRQREIGQTGADFVADVQLVGANLVGVPQDMDLVGKLLHRFIAIHAAHARVVQLFDRQKDISQRTLDAAPLRLGGMRGNHRQITELFQQSGQIEGSDPLTAQHQQGVVKRTRPHLSVALHGTPAFAQGDSFLGNVDQTEIQVESTDDLVERFRLLLIDQVNQLPAS